ncbi:MAG: hypothetical protein JWM64_2925 [Frankiales bacterium]|nr:hypothetical protein [Frankiales bacterium]
MTVRRPGSLAALLADGPALLRRVPGSTVLHLRVAGLEALEARAGVAGVEQLREAALSRTVAAVGPDALVAAAGDAVVVLGRVDPARVLAALSEPLVLADDDGSRLVVTPQVHAGTATGPDLRAAVDAASAASRTAADRAEDVVHADAVVRDATARRRHVERLLERAVPDGLLLLHYQPVVDLPSGAVVGAEALVRLRDGDRLVQPGELVPLAERSGAVVELGTWVLRETCRQTAVWRVRCPTLRSVAVNVSACQVARPDFADVVLAALADCGLPGEALALELTESVLLDAGPVAVAQLFRLQAHGVHTGIDDFGTGYASLSTLRTLPVGFLKVDRSFVSGLTTSRVDRAVVRAVLGLAGDLGLHAVAEGIETRGQLSLLQEMGATCGQGHLLSRPVPPAVFEALVGTPLPLGAALRLPAARTSV